MLRVVPIIVVVVLILALVVGVLLFAQWYARRRVSSETNTRYWIMRGVRHMISDQTPQQTLCGQTVFANEDEPGDADECNDCWLINEKML